MDEVVECFLNEMLSLRTLALEEEGSDVLIDLVERLLALLVLLLERSELRVVVASNTELYK